ncbi:hypothetical protein C8J56DRAFT_1164082 [Mycena floridula]|nr:hypothetical protein C8J56DRAFT_1164082 [Mycena floridula]
MAHFLEMARFLHRRRLPSNIRRLPSNIVVASITSTNSKCNHQSAGPRAGICHMGRALAHKSGVGLDFHRLEIFDRFLTATSLNTSHLPSTISFHHLPQTEQTVLGMGFLRGLSGRLRGSSPAARPSSPASIHSSASRVYSSSAGLVEADSDDVDGDEAAAEEGSEKMTPADQDSIDEQVSYDHVSFNFGSDDDDEIRHEANEEQDGVVPVKAEDDDEEEEEDQSPAPPAAPQAPLLVIPVIPRAPAFAPPAAPVFVAPSAPVFVPPPAPVFVAPAPVIMQPNHQGARALFRDHRRVGDWQTPSREAQEAERDGLTKDQAMRRTAGVPMTGTVRVQYENGRKITTRDGVVISDVPVGLPKRVPVTQPNPIGNVAQAGPSNPVAVQAAPLVRPATSPQASSSQPRASSSQFSRFAITDRAVAAQQIRDRIQPVRYGIFTMSTIALLEFPEHPIDAYDLFVVDISTGDEIALGFYEALDDEASLIVALRRRGATGCIATDWNQLIRVLDTPVDDAAWVSVALNQAPVASGSTRRRPLARLPSRSRLPAARLPSRSPSPDVPVPPSPTGSLKRLREEDEEEEKPVVAKKTKRLGDKGKNIVVGKGKGKAKEEEVEEEEKPKLRGRPAKKVQPAKAKAPSVKAKKALSDKAKGKRRADVVSDDDEEDEDEEEVKPKPKGRKPCRPILEDIPEPKTKKRGREDGDDDDGEGAPPAKEVRRSTRLKK